MTLTARATVFKHGYAKTLYVAIPSSIVSDSQFQIKQGDIVSLEYDPKKNVLSIWRVLTH